MQGTPAFESFAPAILEVYRRDKEAFWAAVMAPFLADRGAVFTWLKHLKVDVTELRVDSYFRRDLKVRAVIS